MDMNLSGKTVIITGGASGLGKAIAEELAREGTNIVLNYRSREADAISLAEYLGKTYMVRCLPVRADMSSHNEAEALFDAALNEFNNIDILINNAGIWPTAYVKDMQTDEFSRTLDINLVSPFILCKCMVNHLQNNKRPGKIINVVSQAAFLGSTTGHAHYAASKAGLVSFTVSLARESAKYGICCNCIAPGMIDTPMTEDIVASKTQKSYYESRIPMERIARPEEVAYAAVFLASDKSDYITGATIDVTGGMLMR